VRAPEVPREVPGGAGPENICVPMFGWYRRTFGYTPKSFPNAWKARERSLTLPLYPGLDTASLSRVIAVLEEVLA